MARVLIAEPVEEIRTLLGLIIAQLGHQPSFANGELPDELDVDVALIEPAAAAGLQLATALRDREEEVPIVFVSVEPPSPRTRALSPVRHVVKPFQRVELARALEAALGVRRGL